MNKKANICSHTSYVIGFAIRKKTGWLNAAKNRSFDVVTRKFWRSLEPWEYWSFSLHTRSDYLWCTTHSSCQNFLVQNPLSAPTQVFQECWSEPPPPPTLPAARSELRHNFFHFEKNSRIIMQNNGLFWKKTDFAISVAYQFAVILK